MSLVEDYLIMFNLEGEICLRPVNQNFLSAWDLPIAKTFVQLFHFSKLFSGSLWFLGVLIKFNYSVVFLVFLHLLSAYVLVKQQCILFLMRKLGKDFGFSTANLLSLNLIVLNFVCSFSFYIKFSILPSNAFLTNGVQIKEKGSTFLDQTFSRNSSSGTAF